jgi:hypothetical protein
LPALCSPTIPTSSATVSRLVAVCVAVWILGRRRFERPDLERYVEAGEPAL